MYYKSWIGLCKTADRAPWTENKFTDDFLNEYEYGFIFLKLYLVMSSQCKVYAPNGYLQHFRSGIQSLYWCQYSPTWIMYQLDVKGAIHICVSQLFCSLSLQCLLISHSNLWKFLCWTWCFLCWDLKMFQVLVVKLLPGKKKKKGAIKLFSK